MSEQISQIIMMAKYLVGAIGILGLFILIVGFFRKEKQLKTGGIYLIILAVVLAVCGYFIYTATVDRANQMIEDAYMMY